MNLAATQALLGLLRVGQKHPTFRLPLELEVVRVLLARALFPHAQNEARQAWVNDQGNGGVATWSHPGKAPSPPVGTRMYVEGTWVEFLRVARDGDGWYPKAPTLVRYRRWKYIDGNAHQDGYTHLPPKQDDPWSAWDRLLPGWQGCTIPLD